jgi:hypothetical protein
MHSAVFANALVFIGAGIFLTMFVSRNMALPFGEILSTLGKVRNGLFDRKVNVTSSGTTCGLPFFLGMRIES